MKTSNQKEYKLQETVIVGKERYVHPLHGTLPQLIKFFGYVLNQTQQRKDDPYYKPKDIQTFIKLVNSIINHPNKLFEGATLELIG